MYVILQGIIVRVTYHCVGVLFKIKISHFALHSYWRLTILFSSHLFFENVVTVRDYSTTVSKIVVGFHCMFFHFVYQILVCYLKCRLIVNSIFILVELLQCYFIFSSLQFGRSKGKAVNRVGLVIAAAGRLGQMWNLCWCWQCLPRYLI